LASCDSDGKIEIGLANIEADPVGAVGECEALGRGQSLLLLIWDWVKSGPATLIRSCCGKPKLAAVFSKALLGKEDDD